MDKKPADTTNGYKRGLWPSYTPLLVSRDINTHINEPDSCIYIYARNYNWGRSNALALPTHYRSIVPPSNRLLCDILARTVQRKEVIGHQLYNA